MAKRQNLGWLLLLVEFDFGPHQIAQPVKRVEHVSNVSLDLTSAAFQLITQRMGLHQMAMLVVLQMSQRLEEVIHDFRRNCEPATRAGIQKRSRNVRQHTAVSGVVIKRLAESRLTVDSARVIEMQIAMRLQRSCAASELNLADVIVALIRELLHVSAAVELLKIGFVVGWIEA